MRLIWAVAVRRRACWVQNVPALSSIASILLLVAVVVQRRPLQHRGVVVGIHFCDPTTPCRTPDPVTPSQIDLAQIREPIGRNVRDGPTTDLLVVLRFGDGRLLDTLLRGKPMMADGAIHRKPGKLMQDFAKIGC
jgi:hypothetical protein